MRLQIDNVWRYTEITITFYPKWIIRSVKDPTCFKKIRVASSGVGGYKYKTLSIIKKGYS